MSDRPRRPHYGVGWHLVDRYPLRPGRPIVFRRANGAWGYDCDCLDQSRCGQSRVSRHNVETHAEALREALQHVAFSHKPRPLPCRTPRPDSVEALEALYAAPAHEGARP